MALSFGNPGGGSTFGQSGFGQSGFGGAAAGGQTGFSGATGGGATGGPSPLLELEDIETEVSIFSKGDSQSLIL